jgi:hypothetical protein
LHQQAIFFQAVFQVEIKVEKKIKPVVLVIFLEILFGAVLLQI